MKNHADSKPHANGKQQLKCLQRDVVKLAAVAVVGDVEFARLLHIKNRAIDLPGEVKRNLQARGGAFGQVFEILFGHYL